MNTYREQKINGYIDENYPNAKIVNYLDDDSDLVYYSDEELSSIDGDWFPLCCYRDEKGKLVYGGREKIVHTYTEGETGAGKTTRFVMQSIRALSSTKGKPSFVIVDIHGEIIENLYSHLKEMGYDIKILNCDNAARSDTYNPFGEIARDCLEKRSVTSDAQNNIRRISEIIQPLEDCNDPIWYQGAMSYTNGCILDKFEDLISGDIPMSCMTLYNIIQNHYWLRNELTGNYGSGSLFNITQYKRKQFGCLSTQKMMSVTDNADKTRASYFGVVENHYDTFGQPTLYALSSNSTINIRDFVNKPTVIVIQSGNTKIGDDLVALMMNDIYTTVVRMGKVSPTKLLPRKIHCFLDEFANCNIADGPEYIKMLTTSRKFGMYWHMILQCDAQLDRKFDTNIGRIIRANSTEIFMGSQDYETEVRFAKSCGQKTVESLESKITQQTPSLVVVDLMTPEKLDLTEEGYIYVKTNRHHLLKSYFEAFYNCPEFKRADSMDEIYPHNTFDYTKTCFYPNDIPPTVTSEEYDVLKYIMSNQVTLRALIAHFKAKVSNIRDILNRLGEVDAIEVSDSGEVSSRLSENQMVLLQYKLDNNCMGELAKPKKKAEKSANPFDFDSRPRRPAKPPKWKNPIIPDISSLAEDLKKHIAENNIKIDMGELSGLTCIPETVLAFLKECSEADNIDDVICVIDFPAKKQNLKFDTIETFIRNNDFKDKDGWICNIVQEFITIKDTGYFPQSMLDAFEDAAGEIQNELTLGNIREIKKIVSGNDDQGCDDNSDSDGDE